MLAFFQIFVLAPTRCLGQDSSHPLGLDWGRLMSPAGPGLGKVDVTPLGLDWGRYRPPGSFLGFQKNGKAGTCHRRPVISVIVGRGGEGVDNYDRYSMRALAFTV